MTTLIGNDEVSPGMSAVPVVTKEDIRHIVSLWTGVPVHEVSTDETNKLLRMEEALHGRIIGQHEAVTAVSRAIRRARVGLSDPRRPIASFVFAGPTGVGKSELAKALAAYYYGSEDAMVRLDMSELMEKHAVAKLLGAPPGYVGHGEGGQLTEAVRRRPHTLVLLDEVEKAHPEVMNVLLQVLDDGRLTDGMGRTVDFSNTLIIMTSNIGGGSGDGSSSKEVVEEEMKRYFRPEFLNRLDETIVFRPLTRHDAKEIAAVMVSDVAARVRDDMGMELRVTERFMDLVVEEGFDPCYGARPLRRAVVRLLEDTLADKVLDGGIKAGDEVSWTLMRPGMSSWSDDGTAVRCSSSRPYLRSTTSCWSFLCIVEILEHIH
jgi:ATP-dependent Clp protease ATP-binding subunit ClpC